MDVLPMARRARGLRLIVVDDNRDAADSLATLVGLWGHECVCVYEPMQAFEVALVHQPDVILTDIAMPAVNGFALAKLIRGQPAMRQPFLVGVSAYGDDDHRQEAEACGIDRYLVKPVDPDELRAMLDGILAAA